MSGTSAELAFLHARQTERELRADGEDRRRSYVAGYEAAIRDVAAHGLDAVRRAHASRASSGSDEPCGPAQCNCGGCVL